MEGLDMTNQLTNEIEKLRNEMIRIASEEGLTAERTMQLSQQLDLLLNRLDRMKKNKVGRCK